MSTYEVPEPIINSPFDEPKQHWFIKSGQEPRLESKRRPALVYPPTDQNRQWDISDGNLKPSLEYSPGLEMALVNQIRERVKSWREAGWPGASRTTLELLTYWRRDGREKRLFFAQMEAAETVIFLNEAREDFRQGLRIPLDEPGENALEAGKKAFLRYACKMATGSGKTTVMGMLAAWSILNKVNAKADARFSDVVLIVCPNVTIRNRLSELDPHHGEASLYRTRDLVPEHLMRLLTRGRVLTTNWHNLALLDAQSGETSARVVKAGVPLRKTETITIDKENTTKRGGRYLTLETLQKQIAAGMIHVFEEKRDRAGNLEKVEVESTRYVESDAKWLERVLGREVGGKQNILVLNDEAHHAYRIRRVERDEDEEDLLGDEDEEKEEFFQEATIWIDGLDRIHKHRGINFCVDLSATPYFLGRVGQDTNKPFPWVVSDFGLVDAIEAGLVKIPQLAVRDTTGAAIPQYFNIWTSILQKLTPAERGGKRANPKPEAILKYAHTPIAMLGGLWEVTRNEWEAAKQERPPVFIVVCKNTKLAKVLYEWLANDVCPTGIGSSKIKGFRNKDGNAYTIRVDFKVVHETDTGEAKSDESRWMRITLDTVGKLDWPKDLQGNSLFPEGFEDLAKKLERPLHPPGRDVRCIVSVGMLTEGWDCNTVTHIIGLRPFMSQLLCEQVVGRGLRRASYELTDKELFSEEVAKVFGVPFEVIPYKANPTGPAPTPKERRHIHAVPGKVQFRIEFPRVEGFTQAVRNRVTVDWDKVPSLSLEPGRFPPEVDMKSLSVSNQGRMSLKGPGRLEGVTLQAHRDKLRVQELVFDVSRGITRQYAAQPSCQVPVQALFPQIMEIVNKYVREKVRVTAPADLKDLFLSPYYGWLVEILQEHITPDTAQGEAPEVPVYETTRGAGSTEDVDFWTSRIEQCREVVRSHINYVVGATLRWEQSAAYYIDRHTKTDAFVKNEGLGFSIPYLNNGQMHDYIPDFIVRLKAEKPHHVIVETKGYDPLEEVKKAAAERWVKAVTADGRYGRWSYAIAKKPEEVSAILDRFASGS